MQKRDVCPVVHIRPSLRRERDTRAIHNVSDELKHQMRRKDKFEKKSSKLKRVRICGFKHLFFFLFFLFVTAYNKS